MNPPDIWSGLKYSEYLKVRVVVVKRA